MDGRGPSLADVLSHVDDAELIELSRDVVRIPSVEISELIDAAKIYVASSLSFLEP